MAYQKMRICIIIGIIIGTNICFCFAEEALNKPNQEVDDFSLVQYKDNGNEKWKLNGKTAEVQDDNVKIDTVSAISYGVDTAFKLRAKEGTLNQVENVVQLKDNVVATTTDGTKLTTEYLEWDAENRNFSTDAPVNIKKADLEVNGCGAVCDIENETAELKKDVSASMNSVNSDKGAGMELDSSKNHKTIIFCDGPLELSYKKNRATFYKNVRVDDAKGTIYADRMDVYFSTDSRRIKSVIAKGNVKIVNGDNVTYSDRAIYLVDQGRIILPNRPKLVIQQSSSNEVK